PCQTSHCEPPEKTTQAGRVGIGRQAGERLKHAIVLQQLRCLDPLEPQDDRIQQRQQHLGAAVGVVALWEPDLVGQSLPQPQSLEEEVKEKGPSKPRQVVAGKGDTESSEPSAMAQHPLQNTRISCRRDNYTVVKLSRRFRIPFAHRAKPCGWPLRP